MKLARALLLTYAMLLAGLAGANGGWPILLAAPVIFGLIYAACWLGEGEK